MGSSFSRYLNTGACWQTTAQRIILRARRSPCRPAVGSSHDVPSDRRPHVALQRASPLSSQEILQRCIFEHRIRQQLLQPGVFNVETLQPLGLVDFQGTTLCYIHVDGRVADGVRAAQTGGGNSALMLLQSADDLGFGEPAALHLWCYQLGQRRRQTEVGEGATSPLASAALPQSVETQKPP